LEGTPTLAERAFQRIVKAIVQGDIEPGQRIKEAQIARQLGISRGPLREAMSRLEGRKLVERTPNLGIRVVGLSRQDLEELFTVREALEGMAARLAATAMTDVELKELGALLDQHSSGDGLKSGTSYYQGSDDEDFHFRIVRSSRNGRLINSLCDELYHQIRIYRYRSSMRPGRALAAFEEHHQILDALKLRNADKAEKAMRHHIQNSRASFTHSIA
jgi:DNA-binding GntR family transcriptional regulator